MKYLFVFFILVLTVITTVSQAAAKHHRNREDTEQFGSPLEIHEIHEIHDINSKLNVIDINVTGLIEIVKSGFNKVSEKLNNLYELMSNKNKTVKISPDKFEDENGYENMTNYSFNDTDPIEQDLIEFDACMSENAPVAKGPISYQQTGPNNDRLERMDLILPKHQSSLKSIKLANLEIDNEVLLRSLQFSCNLEELTLTNVDIKFSNSHFPNSTDTEIYLPKLQKYVIEFSGESRDLDKTQIFPFTKNGSKWNTDIVYKNQPNSGIGLRIIPSKGRIESKYIRFNEQILSNLEPDFDLKELLVTMGSQLNIDSFPSTLKVLSLKYADYGVLELGEILRNTTELQHFEHVDIRRDISLKLSDLPETIESLSLTQTNLQYSPHVNFTNLERLNLNADSSILDREKIDNVENIFPNLKTVFLFKGGPMFENIFKMPSVKQFVAFRSALTSVSPNYEVKGCRTVWCSVLRDADGTAVNMNVDDVGKLIEYIFPEFKTYFDE